LRKFSKLPRKSNKIKKKTADDKTAKKAWVPC
jgi:hypothetical protein